MPKPNRTLLTARSSVPTARRDTLFKRTKSVAQQAGTQSQAPASQASSPVPLLITESRQEFKRLRRALRQEINPRGPIEKMYLADIAYLEWEIKRLRRGKIAMLNTAFRKALEKLLTELMRAPHQESWEVDDKASAIAFDWFSSAKTKKRVAALLASYGLDTTAIEAKVLQVCSSRLAEFDHLLASAESRRLKAVRALTEYRALLARHLVATGNVTESDGAKAESPAGGRVTNNVLALGYRRKNTSAA
jgi:hypothetical protein